MNLDFRNNISLLRHTYFYRYSLGGASAVAWAGLCTLLSNSATVTNVLVIISLFLSCPVLYFQSICVAFSSCVRVTVNSAEYGDLHGADKCVRSGDIILRFRFQNDTASYGIVSKTSA